MGLNIISLNVHGLRDNKKLQNIIDWLKCRNFDIILLQETHIHSDEDITKFNTKWEGKCFFSKGGNHQAGVGILFKEKSELSVSSVSHDLNGRWINVQAEYRNSSMQIMNVYAPCPVGERTVFFESLFAHIRGGAPTVLAGDFNCVEDLYLD